MKNKHILYIMLGLFAVALIVYLLVGRKKADDSKTITDTSTSKQSIDIVKPKAELNSMPKMEVSADGSVSKSVMAMPLEKTSGIYSIS